MLNVNIIHRGTSEEKLDLTFKLFDLDDDQKITKSEVREINKVVNFEHFFHFF